MFIVSIDKSTKAVHIVKHIKEEYPYIKILARAIDVKAMDKLLASGAHWVLAETAESSIRIGEESLHVMGVMPDEINTMLEALRKNDYDLIRQITKD